MLATYVLSIDSCRRALTAPRIEAGKQRFGRFGGVGGRHGRQLSSWEPPTGRDLVVGRRARMARIALCSRTGRASDVVNPCQIPVALALANHPGD